MRDNRPRNLPPQQQQQLAVSVTASRTQFQGPVPPPEMLAAYNQIFPGCADRILKMAESQSSHRQALEASVVSHNISDAKRGQNYAFLLGLTSILSGAGLIALGRTVEGLVAIIGALGTLAALFIWGRRRQEAERQRKLEATPQGQQP